MKTILLISCISCLLLPYDLLSYLAIISEPAQKFCIDALNLKSPGGELTSALLCGHRLSSSSSFHTQLVTHSLIHLLVISGFHLLVLARSLKWSLKFLPQKLARFILVGGIVSFVLIAGSGPPLIRASLSLALAFFVCRQHLALSPLRLSALVGLLCLCVSPSWIHSYSFLLSWLAATGLALVGELKVKNPILICLTVYLLLIVPLLSLGVPHPLSVFSNALLAAPLGFSLLCGAFLCFVWPGFESSYQQYTFLISQLLGELGTPMVKIERMVDFESLKRVLIFYILGLYLFFELCHNFRRNRVLRCL